MARSLTYNSDVRHLIKGITIASMIPLLRGGDLPGIYAFIGMSFWPVFYFINRYKKFIRIYKITEFQQSRMQIYDELQKEKDQINPELTYAR
jgi:hypothetical protein